MALNRGSVDLNSESPADNLLIASYGPTNCCSRPTSPKALASSAVYLRFIPISFRALAVSFLCILVNMVLKPVPILSALSLVVCRTDVNKAISSFKFPPAALNAPPVFLIASIISDASTANSPATALTEPKAEPRSFASTLNCFIIAIAPSVVSLRLSKFGAKAACAIASKASLVSERVKLACFKTTATPIKSLLETPKFLDKFVT